MLENKAPIRVEIYWRTVAFTVALLIGLWFLVQIRDIIILIFISIILLSALLKPVEWLVAKKIPRVLAVVIVYLLLIAGIAFAIGIIVPPLVTQTTDFITRLPQIIEQVNDFLIFNKIPVENLPQVIGQQVQNVAGNVVAIFTRIFSSVFLIFTIFVFTFYSLLEWKKFVRLFSSPFSGKQEKKVLNIITKVEGGLGQWIRGQLTLSIIVGVLTFVGLTILGIPYALPLAMIAGILEIIPIVGPLLSAVPAMLVALTISPLLALAVGALFIIVQQLENHLIVPMVMSRVVGIQPPIVIIALLIGAKLAGVGGAFLAVPVIVVGKIIFQEFLKEDQKIEEELEEI